MSRSRQTGDEPGRGRRNYQNNWVRGSRRGFYFGRRSRTGIGNPTSVALQTPVVQQSTEFSDLPGFYYDPERNRYFRILSEHQGNAVGATRVSELRQKRAECERQKKLAAAYGLGNTSRWNLSQSLNRREQGRVSQEQLLAKILERRVSGMKELVPKKSQVLTDHPDEAVQSCQFLESGSNGKTLLGAWKLLHHQRCRVMCLDVGVEAEAARESDFGLRIRPTEGLCTVSRANVVDLCKAPVDSSVTCVLFIAFPTLPNQGSRVVFHPVPELSALNDIHSDFLGSPIYNIDWTMNTGVWSCAWNTFKMLMGLGLEEYGLIVDVVAETEFRLSSRHRRVLAQQFSQDGTHLFMGLSNDGVSCCDLRLPSHHIVYSLPQRSCHWLKLRKDSDQLLAANFCGEMKLWDLRKRQVVQEFPGHVNTHTRLPCVLDDTESLLFAVGEDGTTRGWSTRTGRLLCAVPSPERVSGPAQIPRLTYSNCWGGLHGNAGLILGFGNHLYSYELRL